MNWSDTFNWLTKEVFPRKFESKFFTKEELTKKCQENAWLKRGGELFKDNTHSEDDYKYSHLVLESLKELKQCFLFGNWAIRQGFIYESLAFINQVNGGDEWWTLKKFPDGILAFESCTMIRIIKGRKGYFEEYIRQMLKATREQCSKLDYLDEAFTKKWERERKPQSVLRVNTRSELRKAI